MNPFAPLYQSCNTGTNAGKYENLPPAPRIIDVELTNACNFRCLFCPTGNKAMTRETGLMTSETFRNLVHECAGHGTGLRFIGWGEPTLHKSLPEFIGMAHKAGLPTHINTNGSNLTSLLSCINAGLSSVKFSFQGVDRKSYAEARNIDYFEQLRAIVRVVYNARGEHEAPYIQVSTTTTYETPEQVKEFRRLFEPFCDTLSVGRTIFGHMDMSAVRLKPQEMETLKRLSGHEPKELDHPRPCPEVNDKLSVAWDGSVRVCCNDFDGHTNLGNINTRPLAEIWRDKVIEDYRKRLSAEDYSGPLCGVCFDYQGLSQGAA